MPSSVGTSPAHSPIECVWSMWPWPLQQLIERKMGTWPNCTVSNNLWPVWSSVNWSSSNGFFSWELGVRGTGNSWLERVTRTRRLWVKVIWGTRIRVSRAVTSLVVQWLRIRLPMQGTQVRALVREDSTCRGATKPVHHNYWACALEPLSHKYWSPHA